MKGVRKIILYTGICLFMTGCATSTNTVVRPTPASQPPAAPAIEKEMAKDMPVITETPMPVAVPVRFTYDQVTNLIGEFLDIKTIDNVSGQTRYAGISDNKIVTLEMVGGKDNIVVASMKLVYPPDIEAVSADLNNAMMLRFFKNIAPEVKEWPNNVKDIMNKFNSMQVGQTKDEDIVLQGKSIKVLYDKTSNSVTITVKARQ